MRHGLTAWMAWFLSALTSFAMASDEPPHTVIWENDDIQIREYAPMILATVSVTGDMRRAGNAGFRPLADYIFGNNQSRDGNENTEIPMTSPVTQTRSTKIAMTTPVTQSATGSETWDVSFVMPSQWSMETLPLPNNTDVELVEMPARRLAVIRFSGSGKLYSDR